MSDQDWGIVDAARTAPLDDVGAPGHVAITRDETLTVRRNAVRGQSGANVTAQAGRDEHCGPDDFVGRVDRIEISRDTANYLLAIIELFSRGHKLKGPASERLVRIQRALGSCTGANGTDASSITAGQSRVTGGTASLKAVVALDLPHSAQRRIDTKAAAQKLEVSRNNVRDLCRRGTLDSIPDDSGRHWITEESVANYTPRRAKG